MVLATAPGVVPVAAVLAVVWAVAGLYLALVPKERRFAAIALVTAVAVAAAAVATADDSRLMGAVLGLLGALLLNLLVVLPDGRLPADRRRWVVAWYVAGIGCGALAGVGDETSWPVVAVVLVAEVAAGLYFAHRRYLAAGLPDRRRMQWIGLALLAWAELSLVLVVLRLMIEWPDPAVAVSLAATAVLPLGLVAATAADLTARVDRLVVHTVSLAGLTVLVIATYVAVVVALDRRVEDSERALLLLSMLATVVAALLFPLLRDRLADVTNRIVYGERVAPEESLRNWAQRLTRAIPLDELLLQLVESLRKSMNLRSAEIFTGGDGRYELVAGVPHRAGAVVGVGEKERAVVARAGVVGGTWLDVWLPDLADTDRVTRVAPIVHGGELLGLIVVTTGPDAEPLDEDDDQVLTELARQVGLALHNVQLDSALQASLEELQRTNVELQESRLRIVSAGDAERRRLERDLHDGAQQHLVAMAVKLTMVEDLVEEDPTAAMHGIEDLRAALKETIVELRALAHGIFPPLLSSGGLPEALPAVTRRSALLTTVDTAGVGRFSPEVESTVYFCCLEAIQNASKHAGSDAEIAVTVTEHEGTLSFAIRDDGAGFDSTAVGFDGHGFVNMRDRVGAVGGVLRVESAPGLGTVILGEIPVPSVAIPTPA